MCAILQLHGGHQRYSRAPTRQRGYLSSERNNAVIKQGMSVGSYGEEFTKYGLDGGFPDLMIDVDIANYWEG